MEKVNGLLLNIKVQIDEWIEEKVAQGPIEPMMRQGFINYIGMLVPTKELKETYQPYIEKKIEELSAKEEKFDEETEEVDARTDLEPKPEESEEPKGDFYNELSEDLDIVEPKKEPAVEEEDATHQKEYLFKKIKLQKEKLNKLKEEILVEINFNSFTKDFGISSLLLSFFSELDNLFDLIDKAVEQDVEPLINEYDQINITLSELIKDIEEERKSEVYSLYDNINRKIKPFIYVYNSFIKNVALLLDLLRPEQ